VRQNGSQQNGLEKKRNSKRHYDSCQQLIRLRPGRESPKALTFKNNKSTLDIRKPLERKDSSTKTRASAENRQVD